MPEKHDEFQPIYLVLNYRLVFSPARLPFPEQYIPDQAVDVLDSICGLVERDEKPNRIVTFGTEDSGSDCRVDYVELLLELGSCVDGPDL